MAAEAFLRVESLSKSFGGREALRKVSFRLARGRMLGLVGPSGSGKSTLARCLAGFEAPDGGTISLDGAVVQAHGLREIQLIFQEAAASLNPRFTAEEIVAEALVIRRVTNGDHVLHRKIAADWMETVGLPHEAARKPALAFSGGERQRLAIARALAAQPKLLILDESLSGLDVVLQAQMAALLDRLRARFELTAILITHDLALAGRMADEIAVMDRGEIVEQAPTRELFPAPRHPRTREMLAASLALALEGAEP
jgi:ABC-type dipeptide/oligopeptide/nickel transport system ATPase subunit